MSKHSNNVSEVLCVGHRGVKQQSQQAQKLNKTKQTTTKKLTLTNRDKNKQTTTKTKKTPL